MQLISSSPLSIEAVLAYRPANGADIRADQLTFLMLALFALDLVLTARLNHLLHIAADMALEIGRAHV